jgi:hypothetical protein
MYEPRYGRPYADACGVEAQRDDGDPPLAVTLDESRHAESDTYQDQWIPKYHTDHQEV